MAVLRGEPDIYLHTGGQYEWDNCAPAAVALAAGLHASRVDGTPLVYNQRDTYLPDLLICRPEHAERVLSIYADVVAESRRPDLSAARRREGLGAHRAMRSLLE